MSTLLHYPPRRMRSLGVLLVCGIALAGLVACAPPEPPQHTLPTLPAVLNITPAPTLDIDATATVYASIVRPSPTTAALYTVQPGDTLSSIAEQFNTTVDALTATNGITDPNALQPGQTLIIPSLLRTPLPTTPTATLSTP